MEKPKMYVRPHNIKITEEREIWYYVSSMKPSLYYGVRNFPHYFRTDSDELVNLNPTYFPTIQKAVEALNAAGYRIVLVGETPCIRD